MPSAVIPEVMPLLGEPFRYHVQSRTKGDSFYLVDLEEFRWNGSCGCPRFEFKMRPELVRGALPCQRLRCWHIQKARDMFLDNVGPKMAAEFYGIQKRRQQPKLENEHDTRPTDTRPTDTRTAGTDRKPVRTYIVQG